MGVDREGGEQSEQEGAIIITTVDMELHSSCSLFFDSLPLLELIHTFAIINFLLLSSLPPYFTFFFSVLLLFVSLSSVLSVSIPRELSLVHGKNKKKNLKCTTLVHLQIKRDKSVVNTQRVRCIRRREPSS